MKLSSSVKEFIKQHENDDVNRLLLSPSKYPDIDIPFAVEQILSRRQIKNKLPSWYKNNDLVLPSGIAAEQCSSEITALYKQRLICEKDCVCDMTGGMGIDSYYFSKKVKHVTYIEHSPAYCKTARYNFSVLGVNNISITEGDATALFSTIPDVSTFYLDPARRGESNKRVFALQECEPDLSVLLPCLTQYAAQIIAKLSPMADIDKTLSLLPCTGEIHIVAVKNEVKELLFVIKQAMTEEPLIHCYNYAADNKEDIFTFTLSEEKNAITTYSEKIEPYLYEPNASILKAGAFKSICRLEVNKLHVSSHLYTSTQLIKDFPGRIFRVEDVLPFSSKLCKNLKKIIPQAHITTRNFPMSATDFRNKTGMKDGGDIYLFATTLKNNSKVIIKSRKV